MKKTLTPELVAYLHDWLGPRGLAFFRRLRRWTGEVSPVFGMKSNRPIPHPVHLREGMTVRNAMRRSGHCESWTDHDLDDNWADAVTAALDTGEQPMTDPPAAAEVATPPTGDQVVKELCFEGRKEIEKLKDFVGVLRGGHVLKGEIGANVTLAYRHLEDARMRLGKAVQAIDGGESCYPR